MNNSIKPGQPWYDTEGKLIQTHGGSILCHEGVFYWYGENKDTLDYEKHGITVCGAILPLICITGRMKGLSFLCPMI